MIVVQTNELDEVTSVLILMEGIEPPTHPYQSVLEGNHNPEDFLGMIFDHETKTILGPVYQEPELQEAPPVI